MKRIQLISAFAACTLLLQSCSENSKNAACDNQVVFETYTSGATYVLLNTAELFGQDRDITFNDSVSLVMPTKIYDVDITALRDSITARALGTSHVTDMHATIKQSLDNTAAELGYKFKRIPQQAEDPRGFSYTNGFIVCLSPEMLVYCVSTETYNPGAAHGMPSKEYLNFYINSDKQGCVLSLSDIFTAKGLKELPDLISERAQDMADVVGPTSVEGLPENGNFFISSEGQIVFAYQPYEIASYAQGFINVAFDPYELVGQMTPLGADIFGLADLEQ